MPVLSVLPMLFDYLKGRPPATTLLDRLFHEGIAVSIVTYAEVYEGIYYGQHPAVSERGLRLFLRTTPVLSITRLIAKQYARIRGELAQKGQLIDQPDLFIAATAMQHHLTLVTRNRKDFERIPNLDIYKAS
jgi:tRNA(fMet)-specific endonuclease VapC